MEDDDVNAGSSETGSVLDESSQDGNTTAADVTSSKRSEDEATSSDSSSVPIQCNFCSRKFLRDSSYKRHLQTHLQEPIQCEYCGRVCPKKSVLVKHLRTHTGEKPYKCNYCDLQFATKPSLDYHLAVHSGDRPFVCQICGKAFIQNSHLTRHIRVHTGEKPYACPHCDMRFSRQGSLQTHLPRHTGEMMFACSHCDRKFTNESTLKYHLKKVSGQKPYKCRFCCWSFINSSHLRKHEKVHLRDGNAKEDDARNKWPRLNRAAVPSIAQQQKSEDYNENDEDVDSVRKEEEELRVKDGPTVVKQEVPSPPSSQHGKFQVRTTTRNYHCVYCPLKFIRRSALQSHLTYHEAQARMQIQEAMLRGMSELATYHELALRLQQSTVPPPRNAATPSIDGTTFSGISSGRSEKHSSPSPVQSSCVLDNNYSLNSMLFSTGCSNSNGQIGNDLTLQSLLGLSSVNNDSKINNISAVGSKSDKRQAPSLRRKNPFPRKLVKKSLE